MTIQDFANIHKGRINLSLLPNGFSSSPSGEIYYCFSLVIGLNIKPKVPYDQFDIDNTPQLIGEIGTTINNSVKDFKLKSNDFTEQYLFENTEIFNSKHKRRWNRLLSKNSFSIKNQATSFGGKISETIANSAPFFDEALLNNIQKHDSHLATIHSALNESNYQKSVDLDILEREKKYDKTIYQGQVKSNEYFNARKTKKEKVEKDLLLLINSIYQHPTMARYYGLIFDFQISIKDKFIEKYIENNSEKIIDLEVLGSNSGYFQESGCFGNTDVPIKSKVKLSTVTSVSENKHYHGLSNYGCVLQNSISYSFSTVSPDHQIQKNKLIGDAVSRNIKEGKKLLEFSDTKRTVTEGIYLFQKPKADALKDLNAVDDCEIGKLGQNIAVYITSDRKPVLSSLCKRTAIYNPVGLGADIKTIEEGWLHTNIAIEQTPAKNKSQSYNPQTIFHWTGQNLCVPRLGAHEDQKINKDEEPQVGGIVGIYENDENEIVKTLGYKFHYELTDGADIQLIENKNYQFLIRQVLSNGYTLPLKSPYAFELTMQDLIKTGTTVFFFDFKEFSLDQDPINSPTLVANKIFEEKEEKTTESGSHIVAYDSRDKNTRLLFPPIIDFQFAHYLGLLSNEVLNASTRHEYQRRGKRLVERAKEKIPPRFKNNSVYYLPDTRGKCLVVTPANWFTRTFLINEGKDIELCQENYFDYSEIENDFPKLEAGDIRLSSANSFDWKISGNILEINGIDGIQLKFNIQLQETRQKSNALFANAALKSFSKSNNSKFLFSINNLPQYAKGEFQVTSARKKPGKPLITQSDLGTISRPQKKGELNKVFYTFKINNSFPYLQTIKQLQIVSDFVILNDDETSNLPEKQIDKKLKDWYNTSDGQNFELLNNELPASVFDKTVHQLETEVYKNNFGLKFNFENSVPWDSIKTDDVLVDFNIGVNFHFKAVYKGTKFLCDFYLNDEEKPFLKDHDTRVDSKILFKYSMGAALTLEIAQNNIIVFTNPDVNLIPYQDLSQRNLSLLPKVEQTLLTISKSANDSFEFLDSSEFFVYRSEPKAFLIRKSLTVQAISRFQEFYPGSKPEDFVSEQSSVIELVLKNNDKPALPVYQITPLIFHQHDLVGDAINSKRSMQILFELDRPLQNEERFALVLSDNNKITPFTSAIGRDLTTFNTGDFSDNVKPDGYLLNEFILDKPDAKYLPKYLDGKSLVVSINSLPGTTYKILPFILYYEVQKNKWIAVLALDQEKLNAKNLNAYNPFLKIVALRYVEDSTTGNFSSEFTQPKFINILSERFVIVKKIFGNEDFWKIDISNKEQIKTDNARKIRTVFVVCLRERSYYGINGDIVISTDSSGLKSLFHVVQDNTIDLQMQRNKSLCVYEFETFDNSILDITKTNWLQDPKVRLVYAENFQ